MKRILVTGASGFLGWNLIKAAPPTWDVYGTYFSTNPPVNHISRLKCDISRFDSLIKTFNEVKPDGVFHLAAISDPNYCQANQSSTHKINQDASINIASLCENLKIPLVYTSTDLVFDGEHAPYRETSQVDPVNTYGKQKANAEKYMRKVYRETIICRMPLMFGYPGPSGNNSTYSMIRNLMEDKPLNLFTDEYRTPVSGRIAAEGLLMAFDHPGITLHLGGPERLSRFELGQKVTEVWNLSSELLNPVLQEDVPMLAPRAKDLSLDSSLAYSMGYRTQPIMDQLFELKESMKIST